VHTIAEISLSTHPLPHMLSLFRVSLNSAGFAIYWKKRVSGGVLMTSGTNVDAPIIPEMCWKEKAERIWPLNENRIIQKQA
jgi:hypothetical protein